ncbi:hypothetical protein M422DRAFT_262759 [Sphaerobolus stellatus SS14]|uniref:Uncharacterized protein n=1 Tax=Sphaerobolus stellatus (strain SS14) TaxID=990650 RepID=A0A0C9VCH0_SPHS4|nr:hypothetical protein M422DRAFT_262759 [Sphaerobolus stellatus SS14]
MPRNSTKKLAAEWARAGKAAKRQEQDEPIVINLISESEEDSDIECTSWQGSVSHTMSDCKDAENSYITVSDGNENIRIDMEDENLEILVGEGVIDGLRKACQVQRDLEGLSTSTPYEIVMEKKGAKQWKEAEANQSLGYNGLSDRRKREIWQEQQEKEAAAAEKRERYVLQKYPFQWLIKI